MGLCVLVLSRLRQRCINKLEFWSMDVYVDIQLLRRCFYPQFDVFYFVRFCTYGSSVRNKLAI